MIKAINLCSIGLAGQVFGYILASKIYIKKNIAPANDSLISLKYGYFLLFFGIFAVFISIGLTVGFSAYFQAGYAGRALLKREAGPVELGLYYSIVGYLFVAYAYFSNCKNRSLATTCFLPVFLIAFISYVSFLGIRRPSFFIVLGLVFLYACYIKIRMPIIYIAIGSFIAFMFGIFASFRQVLSDHGATEAFNYVMNNFSFAWLDLSESELGAPFRSLLDILEYWKDDNPRFGTTYLHSILNIIPSKIYKFGDSLSVEYTNRMFTSEYISIGGNMGFFPVAEGFLNFYHIGVFMEFLIIGGVIKYIERFTRLKPTATSVIIYSITVPWFFFFLRADVSSISKVFFYSVLPAFFLYHIYLKVLNYVHIKSCN